MMGLALFGQAITMALIALGLGYIVCDLADKQKNPLKNTGYVIGSVIIILGAIILINALATAITVNKRMGAGMGPSAAMQQPQQRRPQPYSPSMQPEGQNLPK